MHRHCDILSLEWNSCGRDVDIVEPVLTYLEERHGYSVQRESILDYAGTIARHRPRVFIISNQGGSRLNFRAVKFAAQIGSRVVTFTSEGDYPRSASKSRLEQFFWGWNSDHVCYEDLHLEWTQGNVALIEEHIPEASGCRIRVSGATGFDRYRFWPYPDRDSFLARHGLERFNRTVGVAGWTFDHIVGAYFAAHGQAVTEAVGGTEYVDLHRRALPALRDALDVVTDSMPDTLFILKQHPGVTQEEFSEFTGLEGKDNVLVLRGMDENIADVISASDVWLAYESTTCLEAWMMGRQTLLVNPAGRDFPRSDVASGSPSVMTGSEVTDALKAFFHGRGVHGWEMLAGERERLIGDRIGWDDGLNHVRAAVEIRYVLESPRKTAPPATAFVDEEMRKSRRLRILRTTGLINLPRYGNEQAFVRRMAPRFDAEERRMQASRHAEALRPFWEAKRSMIDRIERKEPDIDDQTGCVG